MAFQTLIAGELFEVLGVVLGRAADPARRQPDVAPYLFWGLGLRVQCLGILVNSGTSIIGNGSHNKQAFEGADFLFIKE